MCKCRHVHQPDFIDKSFLLHTRGLFSPNFAGLMVRQKPHPAKVDDCCNSSKVKPCTPNQSSFSLPHWYRFVFTQLAKRKVVRVVVARPDLQAVAPLALLFPRFQAAFLLQKENRSFSHHRQRLSLQQQNTLPPQHHWIQSWHHVLVPPIRQQSVQLLRIWHLQFLQIRYQRTWLLQCRPLLRFRTSPPCIQLPALSIQSPAPCIRLPFTGHQYKQLRSSLLRLAVARLGLFNQWFVATCQPERPAAVAAIDVRHRARDLARSPPFAPIDLYRSESAHSAGKRRLLNARQIRLLPTLGKLIVAVSLRPVPVMAMTFPTPYSTCSTSRPTSHDSASSRLAVAFV